MTQKIFSAILLLFLFSKGRAQVIESKTTDDEENIFTKVEIEPNTNPKAWLEHVRKHSYLPDSILKDIPPGIYKVTVRFTVDKEGNIGRVKAKNDPGYGLAKKAEKIVLSYKGTWQPASQCGRLVNAYKEQPITFVIPDLNNRPNL